MIQTQTKFIALALLMALSIALPAITTIASAAEVNPAHDANQGNGNEKSFGTCKQEANNDQACIAKK